MKLPKSIEGWVDTASLEFINEHLELHPTAGWGLSIYKNKPVYKAMSKVKIQIVKDSKWSK